jgi:hypothetical protein
MFVREKSNLATVSICSKSSADLCCVRAAAVNALQNSRVRLTIASADGT